MILQRTVEPELMNDKTQAEAYANADFEQSDQLIIDAFDFYFPGTEITGNILDLGCGPGNITFKFANRFPDSVILGIDGSDQMIKLAIERIKHFPGSHHRINFTTGILPVAEVPATNYAAIVSNSLLHHLHKPEVLWNTVNRYASANTKIFIVDLFRPPSKEKAADIVNKYATDEPEILQKDFYNSLLAAFTASEIEQQLIDADLTELQLKIISDRHILIFGELTD